MKREKTYADIAGDDRLAREAYFKSALGDGFWMTCVERKRRIREERSRWLEDCSVALRAQFPVLGRIPAACWRAVAWVLRGGWR